MKGHVQKITTIHYRNGKTEQLDVAEDLVSNMEDVWHVETVVYDGCYIGGSAPCGGAFRTFINCEVLTMDQARERGAPDSILQKSWRSNQVAYGGGDLFHIFDSERDQIREYPFYKRTADGEITMTIMLNVTTVPGEENFHVPYTAGDSEKGNVEQMWKTICSWMESDKDLLLEPEDVELWQCWDCGCEPTKNEPCIFFPPGKQPINGQGCRSKKVA